MIRFREEAASGVTLCSCLSWIVAVASESQVHLRIYTLHTLPARIAAWMQTKNRNLSDPPEKPQIIPAFTQTICRNTNGTLGQFEKEMHDNR